MLRIDNSTSSVLIVDPIPKDLHLLGVSLQSEKYEIEFALDGEKALQWVEKKKFDLILLDMEMPKLDGIKVCKKIRSFKEYDDVPIIMLKSAGNNDLLQSSFDAGAQDYIIKPFETSEILTKVKTHLELKGLRKCQERYSNFIELEFKKRLTDIYISNQQLKFICDKLYVIDELKSEFLNLIGKELNIPVNQLFDELDLLKESCSNGDLQVLSKIEGEAVKLGQYCSMAQHLSRLRSKAGNVLQEDVNLSYIIKQTIKFLKDQISYKKLHVYVQSQIEGISIKGDTELFHICINSIFENIVSSSPIDGTISIGGIKNSEESVIIIKDEKPVIQSKKNETASRIRLQKFKERPDYNLINIIMKAHHGLIEIDESLESGLSVKLIFSNGIKC